MNKTMNVLDSTGVWTKCLEIIRDNINEVSYKTWFVPLKPLSLEDGVLTLQVPSQFFYEWLEEHYVSLMRRTIRRVLGTEGRLQYSVLIEQHEDDTQHLAVNMPTMGNEHSIANPPVNLPLDASRGVPNPNVIPGLKKDSIQSNLNPAYLFDNLIEGECNRLARTSGLAISQSPGSTSFNPLVIYGGVGLGKTHLINAIGNEIKRLYPEKVVMYTSSEKFTNHFIDSVRNQTVNNIQNYYNVVDVLLMDDIQFFSNRERTQDLFFHIFNQLHQTGKQIVMTSDTAPGDLKGIEERLISRFKWGLVAELTSPELDTRISILRKKMYQEGIEIPPNVVEYVAYNITNNIRELEGAMISVLAQSSFNRREIDMDLARQIVKNFVRNSSRELSIETIQKIVCDYFNMPVEKLKEKTRKREVVQARQIAMYFAKQYTKASLKTIGLHFGGRDHSTVIHALNTVNDLMTTDRDFRRFVEDIKKKIQLTSY